MEVLYDLNQDDLYFTTHEGISTVVGPKIEMIWGPVVSTLRRWVPSLDLWYIGQTDNDSS